MWFDGDNMVLIAIQALCIALPAAGLPPWLRRYASNAWALVLPLSIAVVVIAISEVPETADALTWIALFGVPVGAALAFGWAAHGARPALALLAIPLLALAWAFPDDASGQLATTLLVAGSAITLGRLLAGAAPLALIKAGVYAMAALDAYLVFSGKLQQPNHVLVTAAPAPELQLPQLQSAGFGSFSIGYGDYFAAAVVGGVIAAERISGGTLRVQLVAAVALLPLALAWDQLFLVYDVLPATIPPAVALLGADLWLRWRRRTEAVSRIGAAGRPRSAPPAPADRARPSPRPAGTPRS